MAKSCAENEASGQSRHFKWWLSVSSWLIEYFRCAMQNSGDSQILIWCYSLIHSQRLVEW